MTYLKLIACIITVILAGCASHAITPDTDPSFVERNADEHAALRKKIKSLSWRVSKLKKKIANASGPAERTVVERIVAPDLKQLRQRIAEVEKMLREGYRFGREVPDAAPSASPAKPATLDDTSALAQRVTALESRLTETTSKQTKMAQELERDRTLVVDFLEDLDNRIAELEKKAGIADSPPSPRGDQPAQ